MTIKKLHIDFTDEVRSQLRTHNEKWIKHAFGTAPCDRAKVAAGIRGMYAAAKLKEPRIVFVDSPLVMAFAYGAAAWWWHCQKSGGASRRVAATDAATRAATDAATRAATVAATDAATYAATVAATDAATRAATVAATYAATDAATVAATYAATRAATVAATVAATRAATDAATVAATDAATVAATDDATVAATDAATDDATDMRRACITAVRSFCAAQGIDPAGALQCAAFWYRPYQGGRMWAGWLSFLTSFRDLGWLNLPEYAVLKHYEDAADAGFRVMHPEFCIVCENPAAIQIDEQNRPHAEDGPSHRWRDGWSLYFWHGQQVPEDIILDPSSITIERMRGEGNAEIRRCMIERFGVADYLFKTGAKIVDVDTYHDLPRALIRDSFGDQYLYGSDNSTGRIYTMPADPDAKTCRAAHEGIAGFDESILQHQS